MKTLISFLLSLPVLASAAVEPNCAEAKGWPLVPELSDEFEGASLDRAKWDDGCRSFPGRSSSGATGAPLVDGFLFAPENVAVENGELVLTARLLDASEQTRRDAYSRRGPWATSIVKSRAKHAYGYFEIRAQTMKACVSNAFWLYDPHSDDDRVKFTAGDVSEEIDVFELAGRDDFLGKGKGNTTTHFGTLHFYRTPYLEGVVNKLKWNPPRRSFKAPMGFNASDGYHVYGLLWTPEKLVWYVDGKPLHTRENDGLFHRPLHLTLDSEVFTGWFGTPDPKDLPAKFRVDYVRTWACPPPANMAVVPRMKIEKDSYDWFARHEMILARQREIDPEIVFVGDSITHFWAGRDSVGGEGSLPRWKRLWGKYRTLNLGYGWDRTGNVLWRLDHGEMDGVDPKLVVLHIGGNNFSTTKNHVGNTPEQVVEGVLAVLDRIRAKAPRAKVVVMGVFPFGEKPESPHRIKAKAANAVLAAEVPKRPNTVFIDITDRQIGPDGIYPKSLANDFVHPTDAGYDIWFDALRPHLP